MLNLLAEYIKKCYLHYTILLYRAHYPKESFYCQNSLHAFMHNRQRADDISSALFFMQFRRSFRFFLWGSLYSSALISLLLMTRPSLLALIASCNRLLKPVFISISEICLFTVFTDIQSCSLISLLEAPVTSSRSTSISHSVSSVLTIFPNLTAGTLIG